MGLKNEIACSSYGEFFEQFRTLAGAYQDLPMESLYGAYSRTMMNMPQIQNNRVKRISAYPVDYDRTKVAEMLRDVGGNEKPLREVSEALSWTAYPWRKIVKEYQDMMTYRWYITPKYLSPEDAKRDAFWRDYRLAYKLAEQLGIQALAHMAAGQAGREGKVFYSVRSSVDRAHNRVDYCFAQQLPQDYVRIIGLNNLSKYTVSFNMMYFLQPGTDWRQFGDLFAPYVTEFSSRVSRRGGRTVVFAAAGERGADEPEIYKQNGTWYYWVSLPPDRVWTFEIDDVDRMVITPFTGLMLSMADVSRYEDIQISLTQNPLVAMLTGEIPYKNDNSVTKEDPYKLSPSGRKFFESLWYQMMAANNTTGIGIYMAPLENIKLQQLSEAPNATEIAANGYSFAVAKAGLSAILPTDSEARAAMANVSFRIESQYAKQIYRCAERMMNGLIGSLNLRYEFEFHMFGSLSEDDEMLKTAKDGMTLGLLPDTLIYNALRDRSIFDDLSASSMIVESGLLRQRRPLQSTFGAQTDAEAGRPREDDNALDLTEGKEADLDGGK